MFVVNPTAYQNKFERFKFERFKFVLPLKRVNQNFVSTKISSLTKKAVIDLSFKLSYRSIRLLTIHMKETQLRQILKQKPTGSSKFPSHQI